MNAELEALCEADQAERQHHPDYGTAEYWQLRARDAQRRERVRGLMAENALTTAEDSFHAALIFQHGESIEEIWQAHTLALSAAGSGFAPARWLAAAALDRWLMYQGRPQKFGTQFVPDGRGYRLWELDPTTSDADRAAWDVPSLEEQTRRAQQMTLTMPSQPPMDDAPWWLKEAVQRWSQQAAADDVSSSPHLAEDR
jgi:hypothetical protein